MKSTANPLSSTLLCIITIFVQPIIPNTFPKAKCTSKLALFGPLQLRTVLQCTARLPGQLPSSSSAIWRFDTPLPIWRMKLPLAPCPSHERELKAQVRSDAHRNSHLNLDFRLGKVQLACAPSCAQAPGSRCHRRAADGHLGAFSSTALQLTLHTGVRWLRGRRGGRELHAHSASKSANSTPRAVDGPLLEALSCLRGIGAPSLPPSCRRVGAASIGPR